MTGAGKKQKRAAPWRGRPRVDDPKSHPLRIRVSETQIDLLRTKAARAGLSLGAFSRAVLLGKPGPRAVRRPPVELGELARLLGHIGKVGSNVNQLTAHANRTQNLPVLSELRLMRRDLSVMRIATMNALGRKP